ncbi:MAG: translation initiation factor IF-2 [Ruminococcaceae bacterium]|nr:translation initiation factor IF-2 [Oscillospiraceae bacterium]
MAEELMKVKINSLSKELDIKAKDIVSALADCGIDKNVSGVLSEEEFNVLLDALSSAKQTSNINEYIDGKVGLKPSDKELAEIKRAEEEKQRIEKERLEAEAKAKAEQERILAEKKKQEEEAARKAAEEKKKLREAEKNAQAKKKLEKFNERVKQAENASAKNKTQDKSRENKAQQEKKPANYTAPKRHEGGSEEMVEVKRDVRIVDTRGSYVDLSKYDDKHYDYNDNESFRRKSKKPPVNNRKNNRFDKNKKAEPVRATTPTNIVLQEEMIVSELARELRKTTAEVMKKMMKLGFMVTLNQTIDFDTAALVADEFGVTAEKFKVVTIEEKLFDETEDTEDMLQERSPVVVVMGHVDHGKTSLLDAIRHSSVTAGEAGGITQHIGAYRINVMGKDITFLDTPGHEAFTSMRARGAQLTDIAILVVAADDGIMPQTVEAINHAKAAGVSIIVAINKMDKPGANPDTVKQELTKYDLVPEEWGGDVICVPVSALTKKGIDELLENVLLLAEMADLKANPNRLAKGAVIEARLDKGRGPVATVLVQSGTLKVGDIVIAGDAVGRIRAMSDENGKQLKSAGPSVPVEILGLAEVPGAGDMFNAVENERMARELAEQRKEKSKQEQLSAGGKVSLDDLFNQLQSGTKDLNIIVKADVQGSAEAVKASLEKISNEEVRVRVIHSAVGGINKSDVMLAAASNALIVGFNVRPDKGAIDEASLQNVDIRTYRVIYECIEQIEAAIKGMLAPKFREVVLGRAQVRQTIRVPGVGVIAGSYILDGKVTRNSFIRVLRDNIVIFEDKISSLKRFKDDVKEVNEGYECGIGLEKFNDIKEGDEFEAFINEEVND